MRRFLDLVAKLLGLYGALFLVCGVIAMTPQTMAALALSPAEINPWVVDSLASQKADTTVGAGLLFFAFLIEVVALAGGRRILDRFGPCRRPLLSALVVSALIFALAFGARAILKARYNTKTRAAVERLLGTEVKWDKFQAD
jgi:hypothetical protein